MGEMREAALERAMEQAYGGLTPNPDAATAEPQGHIEEILAERGKRYGEFASHARVTQRIKKEINAALGDRSLAYDQFEALDMIAHKIGRIVNGDPDYEDSWDDIAGYAKLVADRIRRDKTWVRK